MEPRPFHDPVPGAARAVGSTPGATGRGEPNVADPFVDTGVLHIQLLTIPGDLVVGLLIGFRWTALGLPDVPIPGWGLATIVAAILVSVNLPMGAFMRRALRAVARTSAPIAIEIGSDGVHLEWPNGPRTGRIPEDVPFDRIRSVLAPNFLRPWSWVQIVPGPTGTEAPSGSAFFLTPSNSLRVRDAWESWKRARPLASSARPGG
jgi:hypothetical protein